MRVSLIITAAGASTRFLSSLASEPSAQPAPGSSFGSEKQPPSKVFFELGGIPVLQRTLSAFENIREIDQILITVQSEVLTQAVRWGKSCRLKKVKWIAGGKTRAESVFNALKKTSPKHEWVMVHDGARPLVDSKTVLKLIKKAPRYDGVLLGKRVVPTLKKISVSGNKVENTVDRTYLAEAETPQLVKRKLLLAAYRSLPNAFSYTDESSLVEAVGGKMGMLLHTEWNPKLTHYTDYQLAEAALASRVRTEKKAAVSDHLRIGLGFDIHRLVPGRQLWVGGVRIPFEKGSLGHSDGDALLHAFTDAILGAMGLGDIGDWFSDKDPRFKNIRSGKLLSEVIMAASKKGWVPVQADANLILEKPRLGPMKLKIRKSAAKFLKLPIDLVSVKARTFEGLPPYGTGDAWGCEAIVVLSRKKVK